MSVQVDTDFLRDLAANGYAIDAATGEAVQQPEALSAVDAAQEELVQLGRPEAPEATGSLDSDVAAPTERLGERIADVLPEPVQDALAKTTAATIATSERVQAESSRIVSRVQGMQDWAAGRQTPGGIGALVFILVVFVWAIVPVSDGKYTRLQLVFYTILGRTRLEGRHILSDAIGTGSGAQAQPPAQGVQGISSNQIGGELAEGIGESIGELAFEQTEG